jgi:hypothetical protein
MVNEYAKVVGNNVGDFGDWGIQERREHRAKAAKRVFSPYVLTIQFVFFG